MYDNLLDVYIGYRPVLFDKGREPSSTVYCLTAGVKTSSILLLGEVGLDINHCPEKVHF